MINVVILDKRHVNHIENNRAQVSTVFFKKQFSWLIMCLSSKKQQF